MSIGNRVYRKQRSARRQRIALLTALGFLLIDAPASAPMLGAPTPPAMRSVDVNGTEFRITLTDGTVLAGPALVGAILTVGAPGKPPTAIRIDSIAPDEKTSGVQLYGLSTMDSRGAWSNLCGPDAEGQRKAFPMSGSLAADGEYHPETPGFSLTCTSGAQAKCVRWGYKPWEPDAGGVSILALYRSCMRMVRADYCGDGRAWTRNGTMIEIYDDARIHTPDASSSMRFEAAWSPKGAVCVRHTRIPDLLTIDSLAAYCPRLAETASESCDESASGALLFNNSN